MSVFKLNSLPISDWPFLPPDSLLWSAFQELERTQYLPADIIQALQFKQLNKLLKHCYENCQYYRIVLSKCGLKNNTVNTIEDLRKIPFLSRRDYQENFNLIRAKALPTGVVANEFPIYTSGTTGVPIAVYKSNLDELWWMAHAMRDFEWNQMIPLNRAASIRLLDGEDAFKGITTSTWLPTNLFESSTAHSIDSRLDPAAQLNWLKAVNPDYLIGLPSNLDVLANLLRGTKHNLNLKMIQVFSETLEPEVKANIESVFKAPVKNLYSSHECGYMASDCPSGNGMHVYAENIIAEVLDGNDNPCEPGETGRLVVTCLTNFVNPFIRYEILDYVTLADKPCDCGRGLPLWKHVEGRMHPMLFLQDGRRKISTGLMLGIRQIGGVHQFQVIQHNKDHFTVRVVPNAEWDADHAARIIQYIQKEVEAPVKVDIEGGAYLERPNGKLKIIVVEGE